MTPHRILITSCIFFIFPPFFAAAGEVWTEADEAKRIEQMNREEQAEFNREQNIYPSQNEDYPSYPNGEWYPPYPHRPKPIYIPQTTTTAKPVVEEKISYTEPAGSWCYYCASPLSMLAPNMKISMEQFLEIRRSAYPFNVANPDCTDPTRHTKLAKQQCRHSYCSTIVLTDPETGVVFTLRGCAENFGAINADTLRNRADNTCKRLHDKLQFQECICKHRKYCSAGEEEKTFQTYDAPAALLVPSGNQALYFNYLCIFLVLGVLLS